MKHWLPPVVAALVVVVLVVSIGTWESRHPRASLASPAKGPVELCEGYPWKDPSSSDERIMNVVLENEGAYIGTQCIPYEVFRVFMIKHAKTWRPDYVVISGSTVCRVGHGVEVFDTLRLLNLYPWFAPIAVRTGSRLPAIEIWRDGIPPEDDERLDHESAAR